MDNNIDIQELINCLTEKLSILEERYCVLEENNKQLKEKLKKYTAPTRHKSYYENHKDKILERNKAYQVSPEKKKEYARRAYLKKKEKEKNANNI
jgi:hypothetical protein